MVFVISNFYDHHGVEWCWFNKVQQKDVPHNFSILNFIKKNCELLKKIVKKYDCAYMRIPRFMNIIFALREIHLSKVVSFA